MTTAVSTPADEEVLRQCLGPALAEVLGRRAEIASVRRRRFELATSYGAQVVEVGLDTGEQVRLFLKDFGSTVRPKDRPPQRCAREVGVYRARRRSRPATPTGRPAP